MASRAYTAIQAFGILVAACSLGQGCGDDGAALPDGGADGGAGDVGIAADVAVDAPQDQGPSPDAGGDVGVGVDVAPPDVTVAPDLKPPPDGQGVACKAHCDCNQGLFCYHGACVADAKTPVHCCAKPGCPPGERCVEAGGSLGICAEDPTFSCTSACDCGPAHCCVGGKCVKDTADPWRPGGTPSAPGCRQGVDATYCCSAPSCHAARAAYGSRLSFFRCFDPSALAGGKVRRHCGGRRCFGTACNCDDAEVCADTVEGAPPGKTCQLLSGGSCVGRALAEAVFGFAPAELLFCCSSSKCVAGQLCDAGWRSHGAFAYARVVGTCGSCGNGSCDPGESPTGCPGDCSCGDGACAAEEVGSCDKDCGKCGDGTCQDWEAPSSCATDCKGGCGDGRCELSERASCPADCPCLDSGFYPVALRVCGDGRCGGAAAWECGDAETCASCPQDCGACEFEVSRSPDVAVGNLNAVWVAQNGERFAVGHGGVALHGDGTSWSPQLTGADSDLYGVFGLSPTQVWATGSGGVVIRYDGKVWTAMPSPTTKNLYGVWASAAADVYVVGEGGVWRWSGSAWTLAKKTKGILRAVWGASASAVFAVGDGGVVVRFAGAAWTSSDVGAANPLLTIWGRGAGEVYAAGVNGAVHRFDGNNWAVHSYVGSDLPVRTAVALTGTSSEIWAAGGMAGERLYRMASGTDEWVLAAELGRPLRGVAALSQGVVAVGQAGSIVRHDGYSLAAEMNPPNNLWGVGGTSATDVYAVGPQGEPLHFDGVTWRRVPVQTSVWLWDVWGDALSQQVWLTGGGFDEAAVVELPAGKLHLPSLALPGLYGAAGRDGKTFTVGFGGSFGHHDGTSWVWSVIPGAPNLYDVWVGPSLDLVAVGKGTAVRYDGSAWKPMGTVPSSTVLRRVWGSSANNIYAVGEQGTVLRFQGSAWIPVDAGVGSRSLHGVWGSGHDRVIAVGKEGTGVIYDGKAWQRLGVDARDYDGTGYGCRELTAVWGPTATDVFIVGEKGLVLRSKPAP